jgi:predicted permease
MRESLARLIDWLRRDTLDRELREELRFHHQQATQEARRAGASEARARLIADARLGDVTRIVEHARDVWAVRWLDHLHHDVRYAVRRLRQAPLFTLGVLATLSLGIGANAAMFDVVDRLMFRPLAALRDPGAVHRVYVQSIERGSLRTNTWISFARYHDLRAGTSSFAQTAVVNERLMVVGVGEAARERRVSAVTASYFGFFDAQPVQGRFFDDSEDRAPIGAPVAVLAHRFWDTQFGRRDVIGESLQVGALVMTIVGVAPPGFAGVDDAQPAALFVPISALGAAVGGPAAATFSSGYQSLWGQMIVRRAPGVPVDAASADITRALRRSWETERGQDARTRLLPVADADPRAIVSALRPGAGPDPALEARTALWVGGVALIVLLIACANVANLLMGRLLSRSREIAMHLALGIGRRRLLAQIQVESLVLALASAAGALVVASWSRTAIFGLLAPGAGADGAWLDGRTLAATLLVAVGTGVLTGLAPMLLVRPDGLAASIKGGARSGLTHGGGLRAALVVTQAALSVVLLAGAVLFVRSLSAVQSAPMGYDPSRVLVATPALRGVALDPPARRALRARLLEAAQASPAVEFAAWRSSIPFGLTGQLLFFVDGIDSVRDLGQFSPQESTADYFKVMGTRILRGRGLTAADRAGTPGVVVVSESMARTLWPGRDALGQCLRFGTPSAACFTVVGIAEDIIAGSFTDAGRNQYYLSIEQTRSEGLGLMIRARGDAASAAEHIRRALQPIMPGAGFVSVQPLGDLVQRGRRSWELGAAMFVAFGLLAVVVAAVGLYGVIAYGVAQRLQELSVRTALGASRGHLLWLAVGRSVWLVAAGLVAGTALAIAAGPRLEPLLYQQSTRDPSVYVSVALLLLLVTIAASAFPASRAARVDPATLLRMD